MDRSPKLQGCWVGIVAIKKPLNRYFIHTNLLYVDVRRSHVFTQQQLNLPMRIANSAPSRPSL